MIVRNWYTQVDETRLDEYSASEQNQSFPIFNHRAGCLGVFFLRTEKGCAALSLREDMAAIDALVRIPIYQETVKKLIKTGLLRGQQRVEVYEVAGGFLGAISSSF